MQFCFYVNTVVILEFSYCVFLKLFIFIIFLCPKFLLGVWERKLGSMTDMRLDFFYNAI